MASPITIHGPSTGPIPVAAHRATAPVFLLHLWLALVVLWAVGIREWVRRNESHTIALIAYLAVQLFFLVALRVAR